MHLLSYIGSKEPYISLKDPYIPTTDPYVPSTFVCADVYREIWSMSNTCTNAFALLYWFKRALYFVKRSLYSDHRSICSVYICVCRCIQGNMVHELHRHTCTFRSILVQKSPIFRKKILIFRPQIHIFRQQCPTYVYIKRVLLLCVQVYIPYIKKCMTFVCADV